MYYFASDMHLGLEGHRSNSREREKLLVKWLEEVSADADAIVLVGDIFDFWYEYRRVIPKGFSRLLGKLSELTDRGIRVHMFTGNHDMWVYDYLTVECGVIIHDKPEVFEAAGKKVFVAHGDNIYIRKPFGVKVMNWVFHSRFLRRAFSSLLHPDLAMKFGHWWSAKSRKSRMLSHDFCGDDENLVRYARAYEKVVKIDYFIFGHIHCAVDYDMGDGSRAIFLGEWIAKPSYAVFKDDGSIELKHYK